MAQREYLTAPVPSTQMPAGMPYIFVNEAAERFAFYGMTSILVAFIPVARWYRPREYIQEETVNP
jgi:dipeptide/tripeptide permease